MSYREPRKFDRKIIIFSGAGLSAESGISTFRDADGTWENHKIEDVCTESTWKRNFELVHKFYSERRVQLANVKPNEAHKTIKRIQDKYPNETIVITQNVDDLLERAGVVDVIHVHGELTKMRCEACGRGWSIGYEEHDITSRCMCDSVKGVRPDIVFFGGQAPKYSEMFKAFDSTMNKDSIVVVVGTMGNVVNVESMVSQTPCTKFLNNLAPSPDLRAKHFTFVMYEPATSALPKIEEMIDELIDEMV